MTDIRTSTNATFTAANGESFRYEDLYAAIQKQLEYHCRTKGRYMQAADREDLFQEIAYKATLAASTFDPGKGSLATWVNQIAVNAERDAYASYVRRTKVLVWNDRKNEEGEFVDSRIASVSDRSDWADREAEQHDAEERISRALDSLNEKYRQVLLLSGQDMAPRHMAPILGISADNAAVLLHRARKALAKRLGYVREHRTLVRGTHTRTTESSQDSVVFCIFVVPTVRILPRRSIYNSRTYTETETETHRYGNNYHHHLRRHHHRPHRRLGLYL